MTVLVRGLEVVMALVLVSAVLATVSETWHEYKARTQALAAQRRAKRAAGEEEGEGPVHARQKRTIAFPTGSVLAVTPIFCIPVVTETNFTGKLHIELPFKLVLPNSSDITNAFGRADDRLGVYSVMMDAMRRFGLDGKACLLRTICEVAETPLKQDGLIGEVVNTLLSVSYGPSSHELQEYGNAEYYGRSYGDCDAVYPDCPVSLYKLLD